MTSEDMLWQVTAPHFCAGLMTRDETAIDAAPILRWAIGKRCSYLRSYFKRKG